VERWVVLHYVWIMGRYVHVIFVIWSLIRLCGNENDNDIVRVSCLRFDQVLVWKDGLCYIMYGLWVVMYMSSLLYGH